MSLKRIYLQKTDGQTYAHVVQKGFWSSCTDNRDTSSSISKHTEK